MQKLFEIPEAERTQETHLAARFQALGTAAEYILVARLLELGHKVALPVTDDDGVDMIVNYKTKVQVKSSANRDAAGQLHVSITSRRFSERRDRHTYIGRNIDVIAVHARDSGAWWLVPRSHLPIKTTTLKLTEHPGMNRRASSASMFRDAWHVFDCEDES
jgi:hypothetical protein